MKQDINSSLRNMFAVVFLTSIVLLLIAEALAFVTEEYNLIVFVQILVYPLMIFYGMIFFRATSFSDDKRFLQKSFFVALIVRVVSVLLLYYLFIEFQGHPFLYGYKDEYTYHIMSTYFSRNPWAPLSEIRYLGLSENYGLYPYVVGFFYRIFGEHTLVARFLNAFLGAVGTIPFYLFVRNLNIGRQTAKLATIFYVFSPNFILFNSLQLKDSLGLLLCFFLLYIGSVLMRTKRLQVAVLLTLVYFITNYLFVYVRGQFFFLFSAFYLVFIFKGISEKKSLFSSRIVLIFFVIVGGYMVGQGAVSAISERMGQFGYDYLGNQFFRYEGWQISGMFGFLLPVITIVLGFLLPLPMLVVLSHQDLLYSPDIFQTPAFMEILFTSLASTFVLINFRKVKTTGISLIILLAGIFYFSLIATGYETHIRQKLLLTSFFLIISSFGISEKMVKPKHFFAVCMIVAILTFAYNLLRISVRGGV